MDKKKLILIIVGTLLAMALVAAALILWLIPAGNKTEEPAQTTGTGAVVDDETGTQGSQEDGDVTVDSNEPTVGVEVEDPTTSGNSGNSGNTGNTGNSGGNNEIDFDDLLGAG